MALLHAHHYPETAKMLSCFFKQVLKMRIRPSGKGKILNDSAHVEQNLSGQNGHTIRILLNLKL